MAKNNKETEQYIQTLLAKAFLFPSYLPAKIFNIKFARNIGPMHFYQYL